MGSDSDLPIVTPAITTLGDLGIETEVRVMSAHRTPEAAHDFSKNAIKNGFGVDNPGKRCRNPHFSGLKTDLALIIGKRWTGIFILPD